jgi:hypothetical protein
MKMEVFRTGQYDISDLNRLQEIQPLDYAKRTVLKRLNYLIGYLKKEMPDILPAFVTKLEKNFEKKIRTSFLENWKYDLTETSKEFLHLKIYPDLLKDALDYFLQLLDYSSNKVWITEIIKIPNKNHIQSFLYHRYENALTLTEILERNQAVRLFKGYIDSYVKSLSSASTKYETLEDFRNARIPKKDDPPNIGWVIVQGKIENGKYPQRKDTCMWADAIEELPDVELTYLAACYGDFQGYNNSNENFILTMPHTVVEGHPYCDCVVHDIRINNDLTHPPKEFFDNLWPTDK